jgi:hypothetical protein
MDTNASRDENTMEGQFQQLNEPGRPHRAGRWRQAQPRAVPNPVQGARRPAHVWGNLGRKPHFHRPSSPPTQSTRRSHYEGQFPVDFSHREVQLERTRPRAVTVTLFDIAYYRLRWTLCFRTSGIATNRRAHEYLFHSDMQSLSGERGALNAT